MAPSQPPGKELREVQSKTKEEGSRGREEKGALTLGILAEAPH